MGTVIVAMIAAVAGTMTARVLGPQMGLRTVFFPARVMALLPAARMSVILGRMALRMMRIGMTMTALFVMRTRASEMGFGPRSPNIRAGQ